MPEPEKIRRREIEIRIPDGPLEQKLDCIAAALLAIREAHKDVMSPRAWGCLNLASEKIGEATLYLNRSTDAAIESSWVDRNGVKFLRP